MRHLFETSLKMSRSARPQELLAGMHFTRTVYAPNSKDGVRGFDDVSKFFNAIRML